MKASQARRTAIVVERLKTEGFESSEAGNHDGSLEHLAEQLLADLDLEDERALDVAPVLLVEEKLVFLRKQLLVERSRLGAERFDVADIIPIVKPEIVSLVALLKSVRAREMRMFAVVSAAIACNTTLVDRRDGRDVVVRKIPSLHQALIANGFVDHNGDPTND